MPTLHILGGGAVKDLVESLASASAEATGYSLECRFGAVNTMVAALREGASANIVILTRALIDKLGREGRVRPGSAADLGQVDTAVAVRAGDEWPAIQNSEDLAAALSAADEIYAPDLLASTAGNHVARVLARLDLVEAVRDRLRVCPNGATAMRALAASKAARPIGCTQVTEILGTAGVSVAAPLPAGLELTTVYTAAVAPGFAEEAACRFIALLAAPEQAALRQRLGFRPC